MPNTKRRNAGLPPDKLTPKQERFAEEYLVDLNATQAAIRAGYSERTAKYTGFELIRKPHVAAAIQAARQKISKKTQVTVERTVQELARIAFADLRKLFDESGNLRPIADLEDDTAAALAAIEVVATKAGEDTTEHTHKVRAWDKPASLDKLMKWFGAYAPDKHEHGGPGGGPIPVSAQLNVYLPDNGRDQAPAGPAASVPGDTG